MDKSLLSGNTTMLILKLLEEQDMYGYKMIETLARESDDTFNLKAGTLYPLLHRLEQGGLVVSYEDVEDGRTRKFYQLTSLGRMQLIGKVAEWKRYIKGVNNVLNGGVCNAM